MYRTQPALTTSWRACICATVSLGRPYAHAQDIPSPRWAYRNRSGDLSKKLVSRPRRFVRERTLEKVDIVDLQALQASLN